MATFVKNELKIHETKIVLHYRGEIIESSKPPASSFVFYDSLGFGFRTQTDCRPTRKGSFLRLNGGCFKLLQTEQMNNIISYLDI